jgi:hypothetical protein
MMPASPLSAIGDAWRLSGQDRPTIVDFRHLFGENVTSAEGVAP